MGHSYRRIGVNGKPRYAAIYHDARGQRRSAGIYVTKREADRAWGAAEADALLGHGRDPRRGKVIFTSYVTGVWLPNHQIEHTTRQRYSYQISKYLVPEFGAMRMADIAPVHVREWITKLKDRGVSASTIADLKTILSAIFTTALNDQIAAIHPCRGVKTPTVARKPRTIVTPEQFDLIHSGLPGARWRMLVELDVETGLRWGELTELRVRDFHAATRMLTVARAVVEINARFREADAPRFWVKDYPKDKEYRRVKLSPEITATLAEHITTHDLGRDDLLFAMPTPGPVIDAAAVDDTPRPPPMSSGSPSRTPPGAPTSTAPCLGTASAAAAARTVAAPMPVTGPNGARQARTIRASVERSTPTATSRAAGSPNRSGNPRSPPPNSTSTSACTTCATPTLPGYSPAAPTSKLSKNASATAACAPPRSISTPFPTPTTPPSTPSAEREPARPDRLPAHARLVVEVLRHDGTQRPFWPAAFPWCIAVGAMSRDGQRRSWYSNHGPWVNVYAPGDDIINAYPQLKYRTFVQGDVRDTSAGVVKWSGTSFAAPIVTGLIAARMSRTGENSAVAAANLMSAARGQFRPEIGPRLFP